MNINLPPATQRPISESGTNALNDPDPSRHAKLRQNLGLKVTQ
jgi:hypothetical protein